jgi:hypothetical protein
MEYVGGVKDTGPCRSGQGRRHTCTHIQDINTLEIETNIRRRIHWRYTFGDRSDLRAGRGADFDLPA